MLLRVPCFRFTADRRSGRSSGYLHQPRRGRLRCAHCRLVLGAGSGVEVNRNSTWSENRRVITEVEVAGDAEDDRNGDQHYGEGEPRAIESECAASEANGPHGIALDDVGVSAVAGHREPEE